MSPLPYRTRRLLSSIGLMVFCAALWRVFPGIAMFTEGAALSIRRFWWVILLLGLATWIWISFRKK